MPDTDIKPLNWKPEPNIGYSVSRRPDGGLAYIFTDLSPATITHWREFSIAHLIDSDRLTTNLYDLRQVHEIPKEAIDIAMELSSDPSTRHIRLAVVIADEKVHSAIEKLALLADPGGLEIEIFMDMAKAEEWLQRPLTRLV